MHQQGKGIAQTQTLVNVFDLICGSTADQKQIPIGRKLTDILLCSFYVKLKKTQHLLICINTLHFCHFFVAMPSGV